MKQKLLMLALMGALVSRESATAQTDMWPTNSPAPYKAPPAQAPASNATVTASGTVSAAATNPSEAASGASAPEAAASTDTNAAMVTQAAVAGEIAANTNVPVAAAAPGQETSAPLVPMTNALPVAQVGEAAANTYAGSAETNTNTASIPLIEFQDVPLTVAIENLARQANINYLLDPKIGYGQPDQNGQIKQEPTLSIRWENVTARQALLALLNNYDLQLVEDPKTQIARIAVKDPSAPLPLFTRVIQLKYASVSNMVQSVQAALTDRRSRVFPDVRTSQMIVVATEDEQDAVQTLVDDLDKPTRQVLIETKLIDVASTPSTAKGINWSGTLAGQNVSFGNGTLVSGSSGSTTIAPGTPVTQQRGQASVTTTPASSTSTTITTAPQPSTLPGGLSWNTLTGLTPAIGFLNADGVQAVISFLNSSYDAQTLSTPRVVTLDNEPATISVTTQFPIIDVTASTAGVSSGSSTITYSNIGTVLQVTPRITANDYIWLKVIPDVSSYFATVNQEIDGQPYQADEFEEKHIETQVMIPNGNTLVMGGLVQDNPTATYNQVPLLGDIPVLGWAFKSESVSLDKENLLIFITPTIVRDDDFQPTTTDFLASKPFRMKEPMNPSSPWNNAEPDWSNPAPSPGEFGSGSQ